MNHKEDYFIPFEEDLSSYLLPKTFTNPFDYEPDPLCILAVSKLQQYLTTQQDWTHNFGLDPSMKGIVAGKMFGVLVVENQDEKIGYLAAFSGKMAGKNKHQMFVPPIYDGLEEDGFLTKGMIELSEMNAEIKALETFENESNRLEIKVLESKRKEHSHHLQEKLFDQYVFLNRVGERQDLRTIFRAHARPKPPSAAGECAAPKLLQYAFRQQLKPLAMAEFWWGVHPKSAAWKHGQYYPACQEKCAPILAHMLKDIDGGD
jgi:tRNA pseudouridine32 synthase / 23S rRNA pseudouridine746 synthase